MKRELALAVLKSMKEVEAALDRLGETVSDDHFDYSPKRDHLTTFRMGRIVGSLEHASNAVTQAIVSFRAIYDIDCDEAKSAPALHFYGVNTNGK